MSNNCLTTKLKGTVQNDELLKIGEIRVDSYAGANYACNLIAVKNTESFTVRVIKGNAMFTINNQQYSSVELAAGSYAIVFDTTVDYSIAISNKYSLEKLFVSFGPTTPQGWGTKCWGIDVADLYYSNALQILHVANSKSTGTINLMDSQGLQSLYTDLPVAEEMLINADSIGECRLTNSDFASDITEVFGDKMLLIILNTNGTKAVGDIRELAAAQVQNGRTSGSIVMYVISGNNLITDNGTLITQAYAQSQGGIYIHIEFDPTYDDGYNIVYNNNSN